MSTDEPNNARPIKTCCDWLYLDWVGFGFDRRQIKYFETINSDGKIGFRLKFLDGEFKEIQWEGTGMNIINTIVDWICELDKLEKTGTKRI